MLRSSRKQPHTCQWQIQPCRPPTARKSANAENIDTSNANTARKLAGNVN